MHVQKTFDRKSSEFSVAYSLLLSTEIVLDYGRKISLRVATKVTRRLHVLLSRSALKLRRQQTRPATH